MRWLESVHYVLGTHLATGGTASLFVGRRISRAGGDWPVVLKRLRPELLHEPLAKQAFLREAMLLSCLDHPGIVRMLDVTEIDGISYLVLEYVRGGDLRQLVRRAKRRNKRFSAAAALLIGRELCAALEHAQLRPRADGKPLGLIHRDISPANVLLSVAGEVKLADFGIALSLHGEGQQGPPGRGQVGYMSPEQARGEELDGRSDVFSVAVLIYELCTNQRLFVGQVGQSMQAIYGETIRPPSHELPELPPLLDEVLLRALSLERTQRTVSASDLYEGLVAAAQDHRLWMDRTGLAHHLHAICGQNPDDWAVVEERSATAVLPPLIAAERLHTTPGPVSVIEHRRPADDRPPEEHSVSLAETRPFARVLDPSSEEHTLRWATLSRTQLGVASSPQVISSAPPALTLSDGDLDAVTRPAPLTLLQDVLGDGLPSPLATGMPTEPLEARVNAQRLARGSVLLRHTWLLLVPLLLLAVVALVYWLRR